VRPLRQITGEAEFNEIFLEEAEIPDENIIGEVGGGWQVAITTLLFERAGLGAAAVLGLKRTMEDVLAVIRGRGLDDDPVVRQRIADLQIGIEAMRLGSLRALTQTMKTGIPGPEGSLIKWQWSDYNQALTELSNEVLGPEGMRVDTDWSYRFLRARANSIEGGTTEVLKNIVAERVLGLPKAR
jgi:alkylation response protein AidB-like acyl-CoA dehydrogenase